MVLGPKKVRISKGGARCGGLVRGAEDGTRCEGWCKVRRVVRGVKGGTRCGRWCDVRRVARGADGALCNARCVRWCEVRRMGRGAEGGAPMFRLTVIDQRSNCCSPAEAGPLSAIILSGGDDVSLVFCLALYLGDLSIDVLSKAQINICAKFLMPAIYFLKASFLLLKTGAPVQVSNRDYFI